MAAEKSGSHEPFDMAKLRELISLMEQHGLTEIDLRQGDQRWQMRRGPTEVMQMVSPPAYSGVSLPLPGPIPASPAPTAPASAKADDGVPIKSPTVGTFYAATGPGDEPFVKVGSRVNPETVVCIIEAMKVFNQIPAEVNGTITEVLAKNGDAIEYGQPLFRVRLG